MVRQSKPRSANRGERSQGKACCPVGSYLSTQMAADWFDLGAEDIQEGKGRSSGVVLS